MFRTAAAAVAFWTMKAATTAVPMVIASRLWKTNKAGAIATLVVPGAARSHPL